MRAKKGEKHKMRRALKKKKKSRSTFGSISGLSNVPEN